MTPPCWRSSLEVSAGMGIAFSLLVLAVGVAFAAYLLNVPTTWIAVGLIAASVALAILRRRTARQRPPPF